MKKLSDDEIMDYTFNKLFGDLDGIRSGSMFGEEGKDTEGEVPNAGHAGVEGVSITVKPLMAAAEEGEKEDDEEEEDDDKLKGIGKMSPLMEQLHGMR